MIPRNEELDKNAKSSRYIYNLTTCLIMGIVETIWVSIVSTIPGLNALNEYMYFVYLLFLDWEPTACSR